jgi:hypothetical protein
VPLPSGKLPRRGVVDNVFEDRHPPGVGEQFRQRHRCRPVHGCHGSTVQMEAGDLLKQGRLADEHRDVGEGIEDVAEILEPFLGQEE